MRENEKSKLVTHARAFIFLTTCGVALLTAGVALIVYKAANSKSSNGKVKGEPNQLKQYKNQDSNVSIKKSNSASTFLEELGITGFAILGCGVFALVLGIIMIFCIWRRYEAIKQTERCPMLDQVYQEELSKVYTGNRKKKKLTAAKPRSHDSSNTNLGKDNSRSLVREKKKKYWFRKRSSDVSDDSFRIAAHHHPSFNLVPIEGLAALSRDHSWQLDHINNHKITEEETDKSFNSQRSDDSNKFYSFLRTMLGGTGKETSDQKKSNDNNNDNGCSEASTSSSETASGKNNNNEEEDDNYLWATASKNDRINKN